MVGDKQFESAEETASSAINLFPGEGNGFAVCQSHRILGNIYRFKGEVEKAIHRHNLALRVASSFDWYDQLFWAHYSQAELFRDQGQFNDAHSHLERAKLHAVNDTYLMGRAVELQAWVWYRQHRLEEARLEAQRAVDIYGKAGAAKDAEDCRGLLWCIQKELNVDCGFPRTLLFLARIDFPSQLSGLNDGVDGDVEFFRCVL